MKQAQPALALVLTVGMTSVAYATPSKPNDPKTIALPSTFQIAQEAPPTAVTSVTYYNTMQFNPFLYLKTDALTQQRSLGRAVWGSNFDYNHFALGDSFKLTLQYQGQYFHYFSAPNDRAFYHRGALHLMKQFGMWNWHAGAQALFKHPAFHAGTSNLDQLYYMVGERPIGLFGFNLLNVGLSVDYFRGGAAGTSYVAPGLVFGYSPPLGDIMGAGFGYRLQYRIATDGGVSGLRHVVSFGFAPNIAPVLPLNLNVGVEAQRGAPLTFFLSTGVGVSPVIPIRQEQKPTVPAPNTPEAQRVPVTNTAPEEQVKAMTTLSVPAIAPADPTSPGSSPVDPGSETGRQLNVIFRFPGE